MKIIRNIRHKYSVENILNKTVDKDVQSILLPLNLMQYCTFCPKYRIKYNVITPNSFASYFVSMIATLLFIFSYMYRGFTVSLYNKLLGNSVFKLFIIYYEMVFYGLGYIMNFVISIIRTNESIRFVLTFQKVHRFLNNKSSSKNFIISSWIFVIVAPCIYFCLFTCICILIEFPYNTLYYCYTVLIFDFNMLYAIRITQLLESKVNLWKLNFQEMENMHCNRMFQAYVDILDCYNIHTHCYQQFVSTIQLF